MEFKSKEELQLMPQTEEEHLIGLEEENESLEGRPSDSHRNTDPDAETKPRKVSVRSKSCSPQGIKALISHDNFGMRETIIQENGKVVSEEGDYVSQVLHLPLDYYELKTNRPLRLKKKLYEFYTAPITKFWGHSIAYITFLMIFSYVVLVKMEPNPSWQEYYVIMYISSLGCEKIREIASSEPVAVSHKFSVWAWNMWNPCDAAAIIFFLIGLCLRMRMSSMQIGRLIFCVDIVYWYLRILNILGVNKYLGPLVTMMGKMVKNMIYFVVLLLVVLMSFGVCRQSILFPDNTFNWTIVRDVFFQPYFMLYGEVFATDIDPECGNDPSQPKCHTGRWITPVVMSMYLLVANILLINLLIAVFNNIFIEVNAVSHQVWMFQRFTVVMEYEQKPVLPPPLIMLSHIFLLLKYCRRKVRGVRETYDNALKLFLDSDDLERLYDFEEECVEGYFREQETKLNMSSDERIKNTAERVDNMYQKVEDINQKENTQTSSIQSVEFRIRKLEDLTEQTLQHLAVIHRFMATYTKDQPFAAELAELGRKKERVRTSREKGDDDAVEHMERARLMPFGRDYLSRRRPTRSLTEVRPDSFLNEGLHLKIDDALARSPEPLIEKSDELSEKDECEETEDESVRDVIVKVTGVVVTKQSGSELSVDHSDSKQGDPVEGSESFDTSIPDFLKSNSLDFRSQGRQIGIQRRMSCDMGGGDIGPQSPRPPLLTKRQLSKTHSEPENATGGDLPEDQNDFPHAAVVERSVTWAEPRIKVIKPKGNPRSMLLAMHSEYTSITDELETVCGLLSPPRTPHLLTPPRPGESPSQTRRNRHHSEMSNPEMALYLEKEHLRDAEDNDYHLMECLIQRHLEDESSDSAFYLGASDSPEFRQHGRSLRRESAIEMPSPTGAQAQQGPAIFCTDTETQQLKLLRTSRPESDKSLKKPTSETMC